jgi:amidophosphoribosyltransferase
VRFPNVYGIDMPAATELVANNRSVQDVQKLIGADWLIYQDLDDLVAACHHDNAKIDEFDTSCFSGEYVTGDVTSEYLERLELERSDEAKSLRRGGERRGNLKVVKRS